MAALARPPAGQQALPADGSSAGSPADGWQRVADGPDGVPTLCRGAGDPAWRDVPDAMSADVALRLRARTEPGSTESFGVAFRRRADDDYYLASVDTRNNNVRLYQQAGVARSLIAGRDLSVSVGQWHDLAVRAIGSQVAIALDGEPVLQTAVDAVAPGSIALWAGPGTRVCFDGLWLAPRRSSG